MPLEEEVAVGDRFVIGTARLVVTEPPPPCRKLGLRFGRKDMVKSFLASGRTGLPSRFGRREVGADDTRHELAAHTAALPVAEITRVYGRGRDDFDTIRRLAALDALPDGLGNVSVAAFGQRIPPDH